MLGRRIGKSNIWRTQHKFLAYHFWVTFKNKTSHSHPISVEIALKGAFFGNGTEPKGWVGLIFEHTLRTECTSFLNVCSLSKPLLRNRVSRAFSIHCKAFSSIGASQIFRVYLPYSAFHSKWSGPLLLAVPAGHLENQRSSHVKLVDSKGQTVLLSA